MTQMLLFPDPRPLVDRLGREFFRRLPEGAGVYLMRDEADTVLYVGKAKNLRRRLGSYRVANPDRLPRRQLRLLRAVTRIELQGCADEPAALAREAELLRNLRPRFNRAGTWPAPPRFLAWRCLGERVELAIFESPDPRWNLHGPLGGGADALRTVLVRLLWFALHPQSGLSGMPSGWFHGRFEEPVILRCGPLAGELNGHLRKLSARAPDAFVDWIRARLADHPHPFDRGVLEADLEYLAGQFQPV